MATVQKIFESVNDVHALALYKYPSTFTIKEVQNTWFQKKFLIMVYEDNEKEVMEYTNRFNNVSTTEEIISIIEQHESVEPYKLTKFGEIIFELKSNQLHVNIFIGNDLVKQFNYKNGDLLDNYIAYLQNDLRSICEKVTSGD